MKTNFEWEKKAVFAKPCPFCGSTNVVTEKKDHYYQGIMSCSYMECKKCGAQVYGEPVRDENGSYDVTYNKAQHQALAAWNRRTA